MATRPGRAGKSKEMTWNEKELSKHILKDKKPTPVDGGAKSSPKAVQRGQVTANRSSSRPGLSSTVPAKRGSAGREGGKNRLSSTEAAGLSQAQSSQSRTGASVRREREPKKKPNPSSSSSLSSVRSREKTEPPSTSRREQSRREGRVSGKEGERRERDRERGGGRERDRERGGGRERDREKVSSGSSQREKQGESPEKDKGPPTGARPQPMKEVKDEDIVEEEDFEYEEEFEEDDYNDDFEEDIEEETESDDSDDLITKSSPATNPDPSDRIDLGEITRVIDNENKDLIQQPQLEPTNSSAVAMSPSQGSLGSQRSMSRRKFVDFSSAKKNEEKERVAKITKKRGQELLAMIELDVVTFDLFDLRPLSEYELYMRSFGVAGTRQSACQTRGETEEKEVQTESAEVREKWVQWPPEDLRGYGGGDEEEEDEEGDERVGDAVRLTSFLKRASQVMSVLLEENAARDDPSQIHSSQSQIPFCSSVTRIQPPKQLIGCTLTSVECSYTHPHVVMTIHVPSGETHEWVPWGGGAICVWSTREPSQPQHLLVSQSPSLCGCFPPLKTPLVCSGTDDGCVLLWDLREAVAMHTRPPGLATPLGHTHIPRSPTFSTAALSLKSGHQSPIISLSPITTSTLHNSHSLTNVTIADDETDTIGLSFQLASLDRSGQLVIWVVVETKPHPQGSESDLGLIPNGRVKLVWSAAINTARSSPDSIPVQTLCVRFHSTDTNHLFLGTDEGTVLHYTRYGRRPIPMWYWSQTEAHCPCDVTSLSFSPWKPDYFLAGYSNGNISLYHIKKEKPLVTWSESTNGIAVCDVEWAWHRPGMFLVIDTNSTLYFWDLTEKTTEPVHTRQRREGSPAVLSFHISPSPSLALCLSSSEVEVNHFTSPPSAVNSLLTNFSNYLDSL